MPRETYVIRNGELVPKHLAGPLNRNANAPTFIPDIEPFVSPIDGTVINSRSQMREHCKVHDVVPTSELKGLPYSPVDVKRGNDSEQRRRIIADQLYRR